MRIRNNISGHRFGKLVAVKPHNFGDSLVKYKCVCDCGSIVFLPGYELTRGRKISCGCFKKPRKRRTIADLSGRKFSRLLVISLHSINKKNLSMFLCLCDCGTRKVVSRANLTSGNTSSCGCIYKEYITRNSLGCAGFSSLMSTYRTNAKKRNLDFMLSKDEFRSLTTGNCHYCGKSPTTVKRANYHKRAAADTSSRGDYRYNGIDRKDSSLGYYMDNCVSCCKSCNYSKGTMLYQDFIDQLQRITEFRTMSQKDTKCDTL